MRSAERDNRSMFFCGLKSLASPFGPMYAYNIHGAIRDTSIRDTKIEHAFIPSKILGQ